MVSNFSMDDSELIKLLSITLIFIIIVGVLIIFSFKDRE